MRSFFVCGLLALVPALALADSFDDLRLSWRQMLIGGTLLDTTIPQIRSALASVNSTGKRYLSSLQTATGRQSLWTDIASTTVSADISSNYSRLHSVALAWATPGQSLYQDSGLLADLRSALAWMDINRYN